MNAVSLPSVPARRVVVTGAAGAIGGCTIRGLLAAGHQVLGLDLPEAPAVASLPGVTYRQVDITDGPALQAAFAGQEMVIHLAAIPTEGDFMTRLLPVNYVGSYQVLEAARLAKLSRVIAVSSSQVVFGHNLETTLVGVDAEYAPLNHYAVSKITLEAMCRLYARRHGMQVLVVRPGWLAHGPGDLVSIGRSARTRNFYLSQDDATRFFVACVASDRLQRPDYRVVYAQSRGEDPTVGLDRAPARDLLGYEGQDLWPHGNPFVPPAS